MKAKKDITKLPKWAQGLLETKDLQIQDRDRRIQSLEQTLPWMEPGMDWFTLFWPRNSPAPPRLFTCSDSGTHCVCTLGKEDYVFVARRRKSDGDI